MVGMQTETATVDRSMEIQFKQLKLELPFSSVNMSV